MADSSEASRREHLSPWTYLRTYKVRVSIGVGMLVATNVLFLAEPILLGKIVDALHEENPAREVANLALLMVVFAFATALTRIGSRVSLFNAARMAEYDLRSDLFAHLLRFEPAYFRDNSTGDVMSRLTNDVQTVRALYGPGILNVVNTAVAFVSVLSMMLLIDPVLTLWAILPYPSMVLFGKLFSRRLFKASRAVQAQLGKLSGSIQEDLSGMSVIKAYTLEDEREQRFSTMSQALLQKNMTLVNVRAQLMPALTGLASISTVILLYVGGTKVIEGDIRLGELVEFLAYMGRLVWPTLALGWMLSLFQRGKAAWSRLEEVMATEPAIVDGGGPDLDDVTGNVEIRDLSLEIDGKAILRNIDIEMKAGTVTAIVGRTGSGKTSLISAIPRLIEVPDGTIFLDGRDINELPLSTLRHAIGYAPQEAFLFSTSIAQNIAFGYERTSTGSDGQATTGEPVVRDSRLMQSSQAAGLSRDIDALANGYDTIVGERGVTLSGGQRQRVALARALATMPRVLILDDSLSSVDAETERDILMHLTELMHGRTAILVSHRVAAVKRADNIVVLDEGRVVETGTHEELLEFGGVYAEVYQSQLDPDELSSELQDESSQHEPSDDEGEPS